MRKLRTKRKNSQSPDSVLQGIWRIKDTLSASMDTTWTGFSPRPGNSVSGGLKMG
jgi:hypothetical protein